jgi:signal transduction histidine kinase
MTDGPSLTVRDDGPGIPTEVRAKIFDRFFTTVNPLTGRRGTGLGLAIVRSLAERHGARITLGDGPGTSVTVEFTRIS